MTARSTTLGNSLRLTSARLQKVVPLCYHLTRMLGRVGKFEQVGFIPERMNMTVSASWTLMETSTKRGGNEEADAYEIQVQAVGFKEV